jgi:hypothetical protein
MFIYAGIDEAGYGPLFGPLVIARSVFALPPLAASRQAAPSPINPPDLWQRLHRGVCKSKSDKRGRIAVNDSKKLHTTGCVKHLELGVLALAGAAPLALKPATFGDWLDALGEKQHRALARLPWYDATPRRPWAALPVANTEGEIAIARALVQTAADSAEVRMLDIGAAVVFEDRFNQMVAATRSKAATSFAFVAGHLLQIWDRFGEHDPSIIVDRQGGRTHYRELLQQCFPLAKMTVLQESEDTSAYRLEERGAGGPAVPAKRASADVHPSASLRTPADSARPAQPALRSMTVTFAVEAEEKHLPVALASMIAKYTRELLMARFQSWFSERAPHIAPTAGYAADAKRFWAEIEPLLPALAIDPRVLRRMH